jgi:hypothetical protein
MGLEFEWDARKAEANLKKHGVAFDEALTVFADPLARIFDDPDHSGRAARDHHRLLREAPPVGGGLHGTLRAGSTHSCAARDEG